MTDYNLPERFVEQYNQVLDFELQRTNDEDFKEYGEQDPRVPGRMARQIAVFLGEGTANTESRGNPEFEFIYRSGEDPAYDGESGLYVAYMHDQFSCQTNERIAILGDDEETLETFGEELYVENDREVREYSPDKWEDDLDSIFKRAQAKGWDSFQGVINKEQKIFERMQNGSYPHL